MNDPAKWSASVKIGIFINMILFIVLLRYQLFLPIILYLRRGKGLYCEILWIFFDHASRNSKMNTMPISVSY